MKRKFVLSLIMCLVVVGGVYVAKEQHLRQERNMAIKKVQEQASKYIIENYEGIKKIEWRGWGISVPSSLDTSMIINDYPTGDYHDVLFSYSANGQKYIKKYTDARFAIQPFSEDNDSLQVMAKELRRQGVRKSSKGSPDAEVIYNWEESK